MSSTPARLLGLENPSLEMDEALAVVGLVSAIVQFVAFGGKIIERLNEFNSGIHEVPKTFAAVKVQLPLPMDTLQRTQQQVLDGHVSVTTATALKPLIDACSVEVKALQIILDKTPHHRNLPAGRGGSWR